MNDSCRYIIYILWETKHGWFIPCCGDICLVLPTVAGRSQQTPLKESLKMGYIPTQTNDMWETADSPLELGDPRFAPITQHSMSSS